MIFEIQKPVVVGVEMYLSWDRWRLQVTRQGRWMVTGILTGTCEALCAGLVKDRGNPDFWRELDGFGVLLDRLQECPEEVQGMEPVLVLEAVEWLRNHQ